MVQTFLIFAALFFGAAAHARYKCEVIEKNGERVHQIEFSRAVTLTTDLTNHTIEFSDYVGKVKVVVNEKASGKNLEQAQAGSTRGPVGSKAQEAAFSGINLEIPGQLKITCR